MRVGVNLVAVSSMYFKELNKHVPFCRLPFSCNFYNLSCLYFCWTSSFFSVCAHPDENQRRQLAAMTGLGLLQVKFWFQNKRTNVKVCSTPLQFWIRLYVCMFPSNSSISCNTLEFPDIFSYSYLSYFTLGISNHYYPFCYLPK